MPNLRRQALADFVASLASPEPSPGSGAAGAVALALAAACAAKAFAISFRHDGAPELNAAAERARTIATIALAGAQRDGADFRAWLTTHAASAAIRLEENADVLASLCAELEQLIRHHTSRVAGSLLADIASAQDLAKAFAAIEKRNRSELREATPKRHPD
jgi:formiminotetrahydrofolate cyclodeaminase